MAGKLDAKQQRRVEEIHGHLMTLSKIKRLVAELESNRAARSSILDTICGNIEKHLSQMRQRALTANIGTLADQAGALSVLAGRSGSGVAIKIRGLNEGLNGITMQLDQALKVALKGEDPDTGPPPAA